MKELYIGTLYRVNGLEVVYTGLTYPLYNFKDRDGNQLTVTAEDLYLEEETTVIEKAETETATVPKTKRSKISE